MFVLLEAGRFLYSDILVDLITSWLSGPDGNLLRLKVGPSNRICVFPEAPDCIIRITLLSGLPLQALKQLPVQRPRFAPNGNRNRKFPRRNFSDISRKTRWKAVGRWSRHSGMKRAR